MAASALKCFQTGLGSNSASAGTMTSSVGFECNVMVQRGRESGEAGQESVVGRSDFHRLSDTNHCIDEDDRPKQDEGSHAANVCRILRLHGYARKWGSRV